MMMRNNSMSQQKNICNQKKTICYSLLNHCANIIEKFVGIVQKSLKNSGYLAGFTKIRVILDLIFAVLFGSSIQTCELTSSPMSMASEHARR